MRPEILFPLFASVTELPGIGPRLSKLVEKAAGGRIVDLLWHLPINRIDRRYRPRIGEAIYGEVATIRVHVERHQPGAKRGHPYRIIVRDETGFMSLVFFNPRKDYLLSVLPEGAVRLVSGKVEEFNGTPQMTHPDYIVPEDKEGDFPDVEPIYGVTAGLTPKVMAKAVHAALERTPALEEWLNPGWVAKNHWPGWRSALEGAHRPDDPHDLEPKAPERMRLAYDELLANQLALAIVRQRMKRRPGRALTGDGRLVRLIMEALPYTLTGAQEQALAEIERDLAEPHRMLRLLQGDVGSGKTVVALLALARAVEAGRQGAMMAPTEILARQHAAGIEPLARSAGMRVALLTGRDKGRVREDILERLAAGEIDILIGTHALFQDTVAFRDLGLAVVDEQHRFGVHQRLQLGSKGAGVDVLVMTATPIPRTLTLTVYGDMDVSRLTEKPAGRKPVETRAVAKTRLGDVIDAVRRAVQDGRQVYWVCPLVEESEVVQATAAEDRFAALAEELGNIVGLVHGRMKSEDKDRTMAAFKEGTLKILVATTVIEVGVDVPNASVIVIEDAERFGLSQLHQLRGRVGRGSAASTCLLLYSAPLGESARARLDIMRKTEDGFVIAEEDLKLRGAGDLLGTKQAGFPTFRLADIDAHGDLLAAARDDAALILAQDPDLEGPRGKALRTLLYLFEKDDGVRFLRSG